jgi:hypothetical protein
VSEANVNGSRDDRIIALARAITTITRASGLDSNSYQAAFGIARELMHAQWSAEWKSATALSPEQGAFNE